MEGKSVCIHIMQESLISTILCVKTVVDKHTFHADPHLAFYLDGDLDQMYLSKINCIFSSSKNNDI